MVEIPPNPSGTRQKETKNDDGDDMIPDHVDGYCKKSRNSSTRSVSDECAVLAVWHLATTTIMTTRRIRIVYPINIMVWLKRMLPNMSFLALLPLSRATPGFILCCCSQRHECDSQQWNANAVGTNSCPTNLWLSYLQSTIQICFSHHGGGRTCH